MNENYYEQQQEVLHLLKLMNDNDLLSYLVLAGSWAEYAYAQSGYLPGFTLALKTVDMDFIIKNLRRPTEKISLPTIVYKNGYSIDHDILLGTTKFITPGGLEIEFLIPQKGSGAEPVLQTNLGVNAQALWHIDCVIKNTVTVDVLGMNVQVPCPEVYVLQKMIIHDERELVKQEKDRASIARLLPYIDLKKAVVLFGEITRKEQKNVQKFIKTHGEEISKDLRLTDKIKFMEFIKDTCPSISQSELQTIIRPISLEDR